MKPLSYFNQIKEASPRKLRVSAILVLFGLIGGVSTFFFVQNFAYAGKIVTSSPLPDLTTAVFQDSGAVIGGSFKWKIHIENVGSADAVFTSNQKLFRNQMPKSGMVKFGIPTISNLRGVAVTGEIICSQRGNLSDDLSCSVSNGKGDSVTMAPSSRFDIYVDVYPTEEGDLSNIRSVLSHNGPKFKKCEIDPENRVPESNESNNNCIPPEGVVVEAVFGCMDPLALNYLPEATEEDGSCTYDADSDGLSDDSDNCPFVANPDQANADDDDLGDACDPYPFPENNLVACSNSIDDDGDGLIDLNDTECAEFSL